LIRESCRQENVALLLVTHSQEVAGQFERVDRLTEINLAGRPRERAEAVS
jgi:putative ABC transport system ATP-binding protein